MESPTGEGMVAGSVVALIATVVRQYGGDAAVDRLLAEAGHGVTADEILDISRWTSFPRAMDLFEVGARLIDEPDLGHRVGEEMLRQYRGTEVHALLRSLGSPNGVIENISQSASKFTTAHVLTAEEAADEHGVVVARAVVDRHHPMWCGFTAGLLSQTSSLFGMDDSEVVETTCHGRGDDRCTFVVRWDRSTGPATETDRRIALLEDEVATFKARFEALQATATELVSAADVAEVLREIVSRAGIAVRATQYVLAVRLTHAGPPEVEHRGFGPEGPSPDLVEGLLADDPDDLGGCRLIVDVATHHRRFGRIAALCPPGSTFLPEERRLLEAYAANAANALEAAASRDEAIRRHQTAQALLDLAHALGEVGDPDETAQRLAEAVPPLIDSPHACVLLWDDDLQRLNFRGFAGYATPTIVALRDVAITAADTPALAVMLEERTPLFIDATSPDPFLRGLLEVTGSRHSVVVPISTHDRFLGVVAAALPDDRVAEDADLLARLGGITSQGATALENARLLEQVHHQGLHDPLSGLPNRRLFRTRIDRALARAVRTGSPPAVIFLDLDHFKALNDTCGHEAGDRVIVAVAERMCSSVRATDTVARLGGDEFAVILEGLTDPPADARRVAEALVEAVRQPLVAMGRTIRISASAGAVLAGPLDDHDSLLHRADATMYKAKSVGRDRAVVDHTHVAWRPPDASAPTA